MAQAPPPSYDAAVVTHSDDDDLELEPGAIPISLTPKAAVVVPDSKSDDDDDFVKRADTVGITVGHAAQAEKEQKLGEPESIERQRSLMDTLGLGRQPSLSNVVSPTSIGNILLGDEFGRQQTELEETFYCQICLNNVPMSEGFSLSMCGHTFCRVCLNGYWTSKIRDGSVFLRCFQTEDDNPPCNTTVPQEDVFEMVDDEIYQKYQKFMANAKHKNARQCPYCDNTQLGSEDEPSMICDECGKFFCYSHSNAHGPDESCAAYERRTIKENKLSSNVISQHSKPCPRCEIAISKTSGCNHMKCARCQCSFCWLCLVEIEDVGIPPHFSDITSRCYKQQFTDDNANQIPRPLQIALLCIFGIPAAVLTLAMVLGCCPCVICCGFIMGDGQFNPLYTLRNIWTGWMIFFVGIIGCIMLVLCAPPVIFVLALYQMLAIVVPCFPDLDFSVMFPEENNGDGNDPFEIMEVAE